ncbi:MAG: hypothetical protein VX246_16600 [Myxococcota bacterium]|nr:hypothetical protein [Myxococcota bacterium]
MKPLLALKQWNGALDRWLLAPEPRAVGRLGLVRIVYSLFYLWYLSHYHAATMGEFPWRRNQMLLIEGFEGSLRFLGVGVPVSPTPFFLECVESTLVAALIFLLVGLFTQTATLVVLLAGLLFEGYYSLVDLEMALIFPVCFIPMFMFLNGRWGETYSVDALRNERRGIPPPDPSSSAGEYFLAARACHIVLSALLLGAFLLKLFDGGNWLYHEHLMRDVPLKMNIEAALLRVPLNPFAPWVSQTPIAYTGLRYGALCFEGLFFLSLFNRNLRAIFVSAALCFHSINAFWLFVTFTPVMAAYFVFIDWEWLRQRVAPRGFPWIRGLPNSVLIGGTIVVAVAFALFWNMGDGLRHALNLGERIDWRTIWFPVFPLAVAWQLYAWFDLGRVMRRYVANRGS